MRCLNKTLIACLLIVAIPVQGYAATTMRMCSPKHHGPVATANATYHHATKHQRAEAHEHNVQMRHDAASNDPVVTAPTADHSHGKCSACASCCVALAIVSRLPVADSVSAPTLEIPFVSTTFSNHIADGLDPPPRPSLA